VVNGYLLRRNGRSVVAYLTDCKRVPEEHISVLKGVPHLILDALRHRPHPTHMSVEEALAVAERVEPGRTWFTHVCHELPHAETEAALPERVRLAYDGLRLEL
jgi:phosphoribosyl 1,2-cyclic phosphate phosphodiesterase